MSDVEPSFAVAQTVYRGLPLAHVLDGFDAMTSLGYSVSLFSSWSELETIDQLWLKRRVDRDPEPPADVLGSPPSPVEMHPIAGVDPVHCTPQLGAPGPWLDRLPHFRLEFTPSAGGELQTEYLLPRGRALEGLRAVRELAQRIRPLLQVTEVRESDAAPIRRYDPGNPLADPQGYVYAPDVDPVAQMVNLISASRSYQAGVEVINTAKELALATLTMGR